jgi:hypothetical protein
MRMLKRVVGIFGSGNVFSEGTQVAKRQEVGESIFVRVEAL